MSVVVVVVFKINDVDDLDRDCREDIADDDINCYDYDDSVAYVAVICFFEYFDDDVADHDKSGSDSDDVRVVYVSGVCVFRNLLTGQHW